MEYRPPMRGSVNQRAIFQKGKLVRLNCNCSKGIILYEDGIVNDYSTGLIKQGIEFCDEFNYMAELVKELKTNPRGVDISSSEKGRRNMKNLYTFNSFAPMFLQEGFSMQDVSRELDFIRKNVTNYLENKSVLENSDVLDLKLRIFRHYLLSTANKDWELSNTAYPDEVLEQIVLN